MSPAEQSAASRRVPYHLVTAGLAAVLFVAAVLSVVMMDAVGGDRPARSGVVSDDSRRSLCALQERLLERYINDGNVQKMEQYQGYLTANDCYGTWR